ncbi:MAG: glutamine--tRNA ligase [Defluviitaleaceae bacterium]|nr:glutamine--tRNA ligase [Defluviitaleaceae bacterium]
MDNITNNFITDFIKEDLGENLNSLITRFPPEPNGHLHIGHAKSIILNGELAKHFGGKFNMRFDDTNPSKESVEFVNSILEDVKWLGYDYGDRLFYASNYFETFYECALNLINKGLAFVCDLTGEQVHEYRGTFTEPGKNSPFRERSIEENLKLFKEMKEGIYKDGEKTLRAKIDMAHPNIVMRDPVIYRIAHIHHHNTSDNWCIYPMYDYAHPLEDAIENITHSLCSLEFENNRPLYNWFIEHAWIGESKPRQIEFGKLSISKSILGKRHLNKLVSEKKVQGFADPRLLTLKGLRSRGYTPEIIKTFVNEVGISKADGTVEIELLEHHARDILKKETKSLMAVLDPLKVVITNYEGEEELELENSSEAELGSRKVLFTKEIYIEASDFMENPPKKFFRLAPGVEVRLKGAYAIVCEEIIKDSSGKITELRCTYDPQTKSGSGFNARKIKGVLHWVSEKYAVKKTVNLIDYLLNEDGSLNENSIVKKEALIEKEITAEDERVQFMRHGYFYKNEEEELNLIVSLKSSFK